ncbi:GntR family transcriptional regulator [Kitasatospora sp. MAA4]|uniref:GntR family transcriptional regulator n=1 Tax=Kitasatospora sp. MAA4 TaxID=3035093 RepID=UPI0024734278|nr:GntR family transcriptional regulator [Kitasatospora sp. MAA4]MDH6131166.1 GntR family transcriptional regulator [Kitasatospora sp. MAA4]
MPAEKTFTRITDHYRRLILTGALPAGTKLPSNKELATKWGVAVETVRRALSQLQVEKLIRTSPRGTFVADETPATSSPADRLEAVRSTMRTFMDGETSIVAAAQLVVPPVYVADLFDLDHGDQVVRREYVAGRSSVRTLFAVDWYPAQFAVLVPDLLSTSPGKNDGLTARILEATDRRVTAARDDMHGRAADAREAAALGLPVGAPILAGASRWGDATGIIQYSEWCLPTRLTIGYDYSL